MVRNAADTHQMLAARAATLVVPQQLPVAVKAATKAALTRVNALRA